MKTITILVTGSGGPLGVNLTRSLLSSPLNINIIGTEANRYHTHMSLAHETNLIPYATQEGYREALQQLIKRHGVDMVLPSHPSEVRAVAGIRDELKPASVFLPPLEEILRGQNKWASWQVWREAGVPVPETILVNHADEAEEIFQKLGAPVWIRGAGVPGAGIGVASLPARSPRHLSMWVDYWNGAGGMIASEFLPGRNLTWLSVWRDGALVAAQSRERLAYVIPHVSPSGITGAPAVSRTISEKKLHQVGMAAVKAIMPRPHGIFFVDMSEKTPGDPRVTEINAGRFGTTIHFYTVAGFNFPELAVRLGLGLGLPQGASAPLLDPLEPELHWIRTLDCGPALVKIDGDNHEVRCAPEAAGDHTILQQP